MQQSGLLSTPFHRAFFNDVIDVSEFTTAQILTSNKTRKIENLPRARTKIPLGFRLNYYINDLSIFRGYYRYYTDNFDVEAHTFSIDLPIKVTPYLTVGPFYRYHTQTASKYFRPFGEHDLAADLFTSDYDNSAFDSNKYGIAIRYTPLQDIGILRTPFTPKAKNSFMHLKAIELRYAAFDRTDGLDASIISFDLSFDLITGRKR